VRVWHTRCYAGGLATLGVALLSPLDALSAALGAAHMAQHVLLVLVAAPLLVSGRPHIAALHLVRGVGMRGARGARILRAMSHGGRSGTWLLVATVGYAALVWFWHWPPAYLAALADERLHIIEHATLLIAALGFWWAIIVRPRTIGAVALFVSGLHSSILGALMLAAQQPWYPAYAQTTAAWGLSARDDQQLAAALMLLPCDLVYLGASLVLVGRALHQPQPAHASTRETQDVASLQQHPPIRPSSTPAHQTEALCD
jgi:putative membrane protein